jgi:hypothetical protein
MPIEMKVTAKPDNTQMLLKTYNIKLEINILTENAYDKTWKFPTYLGMNIGMSMITGKVSWTDDDGDHEIELNGTGTIWNMRKF